MSDLSLPWHEIQAGRSTWRLVFYPPIIWRGEHVYGLTWFRKREILLDATMPARRIQQVRRHELFHAHAFEARGRRPAGEAESLHEEDFARMFERHPLFGDTDVALPAGFAAFRRRCRGLQKVVT